jgi:RHS repeat-associated protein
MAGLTDQAGSATSFAYDNRGLLLSRTDPLGKTSSLSYYDDGKLHTRTDRKGHAVSYSYTPSGKVEEIGYPAGASVHFTYDQRDNCTGMTDALGATAYVYDEANRLISSTDPHGFTVSYAYDGAGNLSSLTYPGDRRVLYTYDALNRLETVTIEWLGKQALYHYDGAGRVTKLDQFNGTRADYTYDNANRMTALANRKSNGSAIATFSFALDANGQRTRTVETIPLEMEPQEGAADYAYNAERNRLLAAGSSSFAYDLEGQLRTGYGNTYAFNYEHRLTSAGTSSYAYDGAGRRLRAVRGGATTRYIYDVSGNLLAEANGSNSITRLYIYGRGLLAVATSSNALYCYHFNAVGSTMALTNQSQSVVNQYAYAPFGEITGQVEAIVQPFKYVGQFGVMAESNGLYYMRARYYDPQVGRFISEDPLGFDGGDVNLYVYASNNPVMLVDPLGLWTVGIGITMSFQFGAVNLNFSGGLVADGAGNIGTYTCGGGGLGMGARVSGGISTSVSNAMTISDLSGPFTNGSLGGGWGANASGDYFTGPSDNGWVTGGGVTVGAGLGGGGSSSITYTKISPIGNLLGSFNMSNK